MGSAREGAEGHEDRPREEREKRESSLALRYRLGDRAALAELYAEMEPLVHGFLRPHLSPPRTLPPGIEAEDLYQQAYVALAEAVLEWRPDRYDNFVPYFFHSFPWRIDRYLRSQTPSRRTARVQLLSLSHDDLMERAAGVAGLDGRDWDEYLACAELVRGLPRLCGLVVWLHLYHDLSFPEVAEATGISRSTAYAAFGRALSLLRSSLAQPQPGLAGLAGPGACHGGLSSAGSGVPPVAPAGSEACSGGLPESGTPPAAPPGSGVSPGPVSRKTLRRCVELLHRLAPDGGPLPAREKVCGAVGLTRPEYQRIMARLCASGCIVGRRRGSPGSLACATVWETMKRVQAWTWL